MDLIYTTQKQTQIFVDHGIKSEYDFIVRYKETNKRKRTPRHIHLVVDLFSKRTGDLALTNELIDYIIDLILNCSPAEKYPPTLQMFTTRAIEKYSNLDNYGEYSVEFLLVVTELIMIQEKTNYPRGTLNLRLFQKFRNGADIFSTVSAATFR